MGWMGFYYGGGLFLMLDKRRWRVLTSYGMG